MQPYSSPRYSSNLETSANTVPLYSNLRQSPGACLVLGYQGAPVLLWPSTLASRLSVETGFDSGEATRLPSYCSEATARSTGPSTSRLGIT